jgi:hypothetical protein
LHSRGSRDQVEVVVVVVVGVVLPGVVPPGLLFAPTPPEPPPLIIAAIMATKAVPPMIAATVLPDCASLTPAGLPGAKPSALAEKALVVIRAVERSTAQRLRIETLPLK